MAVRHPVIGVEGNIGIGKSTLIDEALAFLKKDFGFIQPMAFREPVDDEANATPFLLDYYKDPHRWSFTQQVDFLTRRVDIQEMAQLWAKTYGPALIDRTFYGDTSFFWKCLKDGTTTQREFDTYEHIYETFSRRVHLPTALIYLRCDPEILLDRIKRRARPGEEGITLDYLQGIEHNNDAMVEVLRQQGVYVEPVSWDLDRAAAQDRAPEIKAVLKRILAWRGPDLFTEKHRRIAGV